MKPDLENFIMRKRLFLMRFHLQLMDEKEFKKWAKNGSRFKVLVTVQC